VPAASWRPALGAWGPLRPSRCGCGENRARRLPLHGAARAGRSAGHRIGIPDPRMSSTHARLQSVLGNWVVQDAGSKNGTWVDGRRVNSATLVDGALVEVGHSFLLYREALPAAGPAFADARELHPPAERLATLSPLLEAELDRLVLMAHSRVSILVRGETGTG